MRFRLQRSSGRILLFFALPLAALFLPAAVLPIGISALNPFLGVSAAIAARTAGFAFLCTLPIALIVFRYPRFLCRFLCPMGWLSKMCGKVRPRARRLYGGIPRIGWWMALLTLGGAMAACPWFLFLDPFGLFLGLTGVDAYWVYGIGFLAFVFLSILLPGLWCARLCPLGGVQDLATDLRCTISSRTAQPSRVGLDDSSNDAAPLGRRAFFGFCGGAAATLLMPKPSDASAATPLRPPGACSERALKSLCIRCGSCSRVCPTRIIHPSLNLSDISGLLTPVVGFTKGHCLDTCAQCGAACPTGALSALPVTAKNERIIGIARLDLDRCLLSHETECGHCITVCTRLAISEQFSKKRYTTSVRIHETRCNGCGACISVCPPRALRVTNERGEG